MNTECHEQGNVSKSFLYKKDLLTKNIRCTKIAIVAKLMDIFGCHFYAFSKKLSYMIHFLYLNIYGEQKCIYLGRSQEANAESEIFQKKRGETKVLNSGALTEWMALIKVICQSSIAFVHFVVVAAKCQQLFWQIPEIC